LVLVIVVLLPVDLNELLTNDSEYIESISAEENIIALVPAGNL
jgi:hypothetical protein